MKHSLAHETAMHASASGRNLADTYLCTGEPLVKLSLRAEERATGNIWEASPAGVVSDLGLED